MKIILPLLALVLISPPVWSQEELPRAEAVKFAALLNFDLDKLADTPISTDADTKRPFGLKAEKRGALAVPEAKLSAATFTGAGRQTASVGQLWLAGLVPAKDGQAVDKDQLKLVTIEHEGNQVSLTLCVLGVRKGAGDRLELLVFGKGKEALLVEPLKPVTREQQAPLELRVEREGEAAARLTLSLVGKYEASFLVKTASE